MKALTTEELLHVLKVAKSRSTRDHAMILLAYRHGLRASEVCSLTLDNVDVRTQSIDVQRLKGSRHTVQALQTHRGQPLLDEIAVIKAWLAERPKDGSSFLFVSQKGGALSRMQFFRIVRDCCLAAGVAAELAHPHVLKHSLCTHMLEANVNLGLIQQSAGHKSISSTMQYAHASDGQADAARQSALMQLF
jgi:site-specific recombinase XerD